jgi:hypothetical protein
MFNIWVCYCDVPSVSEDVGSLRQTHRFKARKHSPSGEYVIFDLPKIT